jgi:hypothetical protein
LNLRIICILVNLVVIFILNKFASNNERKIDFDKQANGKAQRVIDEYNFYF